MSQVNPQTTSETKLETGLDSQNPESDQLANRSKPAISPPPNGGLTAWLQVLGAFCLWFSTWGIALSFGVFQAFYQKTYLSTYTPSDISWIGTMQAFLVFIGGVLSGPLFDRGYMRYLTVTGAVLVTSGIMTASAATRFYSIFLSLGVCSGLGMGLLFVPSISIVGTYFTTKRPIAAGITATGAGVGIVVFSTIFRPLVESVGYGWTMRINGFISLAGLLLAIAVLKQRPTTTPPRKLFDWAAFRERPFVIFCAANFFIMCGVYVPFFYIAEFAQKVGMAEGLSYNMLAVMSAGSIFGRIIPSMMVAKYGLFPVFNLLCLIAGMLVFIWGAVHNLGGVVAFALVYGFISGGMISIQPVAVQYLAPLHLIGTRTGMVLGFDALGVLVGNPIAGAILNSRGGYSGVQAFGGSILLVSAVLVFWTFQSLQMEKEKEDK